MEPDFFRWGEIWPQAKQEQEKTTYIYRNHKMRAKQDANNRFKKIIPLIWTKTILFSPKYITSKSFNLYKFYKYQLLSGNEMTICLEYWDRVLQVYYNRLEGSRRLDAFDVFVYVWGCTTTIVPTSEWSAFYLQMLCSDGASNCIQSTGCMHRHVSSICGAWY